MTFDDFTKKIISEIADELRTKQKCLTFDITPTANSVNPVTSEGVKGYVDDSVATVCNKITLEIDNDFKLTAKLYNGNTLLFTSNVIDLPLESVVVSGSYDSTNKKIILTLENGNTIEFSVADLINGLQTEITSSNKLSADLVDDSSTTNKFVTSSDKTNWNNKLDKVTTTTEVMQAYIKQVDGTQIMVYVHWNNIRDTIPIRDQTGNVRVATTPTTGTHATSKTYVDGLVTVKSMTYSDLATLKSNNGLVAGTYYRITDYVTKVNGKVNNVSDVARSAEHAFDVIVLATSNNTFCEEASAILHSGDTYFANSDLKAWKLWYCFENDTNRFEWADTTNGKGVIYRMIDEFENDLPYDFKNVQFKRYKITSTTDSRQSGLVGMYLGFEDNYGVVSDTADYKWCYTFTKSSDESELSYVAYNNTAYNNGHYVKQVKIGQYLCDSPNYRGVQALNNIVFITPYTIVDMQIGVNSFNDTLVGNEDITYSYYGEMFRRNIILGNQSHNRVDECMEDNVLGSGTLSNDIQWNKIANHFSKNFAIILRSNTIGCNAKETKYPGEFSYNAVNVSIQNSDFSNMSSILRSTISLITNSTLSGNGIQESTFGSLKHVTMNVNVLLGCRFQFLQYATFTQGASTVNIMNLTVGAVYGTSSDVYNIPLSDLPNINGNRFIKTIGWDRGDTSNPFILTYTYDSIDETNLGFKTSKYAYINGVWTEITTYLSDVEMETLISEVF